MQLLKKESTIGFISTSDGINPDNKDRIEELIRILGNFGLNVILSKTVYKIDDYFSGTPRERAYELMSFFLNEKISAIFDISGGDSCNQILPYLDFKLIRKHKKIVVGYSDVSVLLNSLFKLSSIKSVYYNVHNLYGEDCKNQHLFFSKFFLENSNNKILFPYSWLNCNSMKGVVIGGNIRCFLKLAGTKYIPDSDGKILFLEAFSGSLNKILSLFAQIEQLDFLKKISGIILGNFYEIEKKREDNLLIDYIFQINEKYNLPIIKTNNLGHKNDSLGFGIGDKIDISSNQIEKNNLNTLFS